MYSRHLLLAGVVAGLAFPAAAGAQAPAPATVEAYGTGAVKPAPKDEKSNTSIAASVQVALDKALPRAVADARAQAQELARAAGLTLGALTAVSNESQPSPFFSPFGQEGTFGPGRFCGTVRTPRYRTVDGKRVRVGTRTRRTCRVPATVTRTVKLTYSASPPAA